ncbi:MAG: TonB-dependent receptor [Sphingomicrobium sp.]
MQSISSAMLVSASVLALAAPTVATAQTKPASATTASQRSADALQDIVVTGTLIRNTKVVGSQTISVDSKAIADKGASSTNELLGLIPQIANAFNGRFEGDPRGVSAGISINRPDLRHIPSANTTSGALTLVLMDGMRLTPVGVNQASVDVDIIPAAVLAGVDVVTDGGSSLYGADAVAGVLNFRTMRKFDGVKVDGNFGFGTTFKGFHEWDAAITAGKSWTRGNAYISVGHSERDGILNGQTKFATGLVYDGLGNASYNYTQCLSPVSTVTKYFFFGRGYTTNPAAPGAGTFASGTACDGVSATTYVPQQKRSNVFAALSQEVADNIDLRVTAYWTKRDTEFVNFPRGYTTPGQVFVPPAVNPPIGTLITVQGGIGFSFGANSAYVNTPTRVGFETWGITPELSVKLGGNWQLRNSVHFGRSTNFQSFPDIDSAKAQSYINSGQLNPFNAGAASSSVISDITNYENAQDTTHQLFMLRSIADGPVFRLPGGDAKLAVGVEYQDNSAKSRLAAGTIGSISSLPYMKAERNSKSAFTEISLPVASFLDVSGSVRYDSYSDFGTTTNPSIGATFKPISWLRIFGHWNTSFNAPTALDNLAIATGRYRCGLYDVGGPRRPTDPLARDTSKQGTCAMVLQGSSPGLQPQTAKSWAVGFDMNPVPGLRFGGEYYSINLKHALGTLNPSIDSTYVTSPNLYTYNVDQPSYSALLASLSNGTSLANQQPLASNVAIIVDTRTTNLNAAKLQGIDFHVNYDTETRFGHLALGISGTEAFQALISNGSIQSDELGHGSPDFSAVSFVGLTRGPVSAKVTVYYSGKFRDTAVNYLNVVENVKPFVVTNLALGYNFGDTDGPLGGTSFRVLVDNAFDVSPQVIKRKNTNNLTYNNFTLGRVIKLGFSKKF